MNKIITPEEMRRIELLSFEEGVKDSDLMENVGEEVADYIERLVTANQMEKSVVLLVGKGNNGGDALVSGLYLIEKGFDVQAVMWHQNPELSPLCLSSKKRFLDAGGDMYTLSELPSLLFHTSLIVDGIFGTGFKGTVTGKEREAIYLANHCSKPTIAIDIPSGLNGKTGAVEDIAIESTITLSLCYPKTGFFLGEGWNWVGKIENLSIGLPEKYMNEAESSMELISEEDLLTKIPPIQRNRHKYQRGHVVILAGSRGMTGSAYLSSLGAFRGGSGMVHLFTKEGMEDAFHNLPELILVPYDKLDPEEIVTHINKASACVIGPGLGRTGEETHLLSQILPQIDVPTVIDADALYFLGGHSVNLPENSLLTPHRGEMLRMLSSMPENDSEFIEACQIESTKRGVPILLKGGPTLLIDGDHPPQVIPFGDPGMATAGCGDLLTGIIASLFAQGLSTTDGALLGASLHGLAGEFAAAKYTSYCTKTLDIAEEIPTAYQHLLA